MKKTISIFTDAFYPQLNGVVTYTLNITNELARRGNKVLLIYPKPKRGSKSPKLQLHENVKTIPVLGVKMRFYPDFQFTFPLQPQLPVSLKRYDVDIINFQTPFTLGAEAIFYSQLMRKPLVGTFHTFVATKEYISHSKVLSRMKNPEKAVWNFLKLFYNRSDRIISVSKYTKGELRKNGIRQPIDVINCNINFDKFGDRPSSIDIKDNAFVFVGRIAEEKNLKKLF
ncbi:MAG: glycosyltransferase, partial [Nanoarchaeota archaeon]